MTIGVCAPTVETTSDIHACTFGSPTGHVMRSYHFIAT
jgi:hypothetical protein